MNLGILKSSMKSNGLPHASILMKRLILLTLLFSLPVCADPYSTFEELSQNEVEGVDYKIIVKDQNSSISFFAVHGGKIEPGTSELIEEIGGKFNQYHFMGIKEINNFSLHITSSRFNEPRALDLAKKSKQCLSLHGYIGKGENAVCIGGGNLNLAQKVSAVLTQSELGFDVIYPCQRYPGLHPRNIVNLCEDKGAQIEMSGEVRARILSDKDFRKKFAKVLQNIL